MLPLVQLDSKGLYTYPNPLSQVPPGALAIAQNVVIDRPGVAETRRGVDFYGDDLPSDAVKAFVYMTRLLVYCADGELVYDSDGSGTWVTYSGLYSPPSGGFLNSTQANGNFYFTTNNGVYKNDSLTGTPRQAGAPEGLDVQVAVDGVGTAVPTNSQVAYAIVWGYIDENDNLILGAPTQWAFYVNTSGATNDIEITTTIPAGVTTSYFAQIYRTAATSSSSIVPGNTFQLVTEYTPDGTDISNKFITVVDATPDSLLGAYLYTADGQPTPLPNTPPPLCLDVTTYNSMTFYINFQTLQQATFTLASAGSPLGIQVGDTFTITDQGGALTRTYTGAANNNFAIQEFKVDTAGTIAQDIDATARNLVAAINQDPGNTLWYAYYQTGTNVLPGGVILKARDLQAGAFYLNSSRQTCWTPVIPAGPATDYISSNTSSPDSFMVSKVSQPEAVPVAYTIPVQSGNITIQLYRGLALQDALYLFTNGGVFRVTGSDPTSLQVILFDSSALLVGLQTPVILNNSIYYYATQGICNVSSGGNQILSRNIERDIIQLSTLTNFTSLAFGCAYESDRKYILFSPANAIDDVCLQEYVYNWITTAFTLWTRPAAAGIVNQSTNKLYMANGVHVYEERKTMSNQDYADEEIAITINSIDTTLDEFTLADSTEVLIGDVIQQEVAGEQFSTQVVGNNTSTGVVVVDDVTGFVTGSAQDFRSINTLLQYTPLTCGFPQNMKKFSNWKFAFTNANFAELPVTFTSDLYSTPEQAILSPVGSGGWGVQPWGTFPWGVSGANEQLIPCNPSLNTSYARWIIVKLQLTQAFTSLSFDGLTASFDVVSNRGR